MRVFKEKGFARFQRKERMSNDALCNSIRDAEAGLIDADLGHGLIKQRVARPGKGKRGSYRTIIAYRSTSRAIFLFGFAKSRKANLDADELKVLVRVGSRWLKAHDVEIEKALETDELTEVDCDDEEEAQA